MNNHERGTQRLWVAGALLAAWLAFTAWLRPLMLPDEGRYVGVAWQMLTSGNWLTPTLDGLPFFHKPPLFYWISASAMSIFGMHELPARLPSLFAAWMTGMGLFVFVRRWCDERLARLSLFALALQPFFFCGAQFANLDMLVAGFISVTVMALAHAQLSREQGVPYRRKLLLAYLLSALGVLAKGLIGFVLPGLVIVIWLLCRRRARDILGLLWLPGIALLLAVTAPWFALEQREYPDFLYYFFVVQHFKRFAGTGFNNVQPLWFYPAALAVFGLPWLYWWARHWRDAVVDLASPPRGQRNPVYSLMWIWPAVIVGFFSMPHSKLVGYVLPVVAPMAFWAAAALAVRDEPTKRARIGWRISALGAIVMCMGAVAWLTVKPIHTARDIGLALGAQRAEGEAVLMVGAYAYDVPLYAHLNELVPAVDDWDPVKVQNNDDWHKELADAGRFEPERAKRLLISPQQARESLCGKPGAWLVAQHDPRSLIEGLGRATQITAQGPWQLWHVLPMTGPGFGC